MAESEPDLDLRSVRYFTVVAEHRHFGRAAQALHITQPSLSRQIRALERRLGTPLLDRTPHGTRLTEAGEVFLPRAKALLRSSAQAVSATRAAARPRRIAIGHTLHVPVLPAVRELRHRHPDADVRVVQLAWNEPRAALLERRVDAAVCRLPLRDAGLQVTLLYDEPRVVLVARDHRLAGKDHVTLDDLDGEPIPRLPDPLWNAYWRLVPRSDGPLVESPEEKFEIVAAGQAVAIVSAGLRADHLGVTSVPLDGVPPSQVALATRAGDDNPLLTPFRESALLRLTGQHGR
ncbi:LysR substrate-binding domain-containing protein [Nonomuraea sp. NPDC049419]|uniref:LysR family transcriptional regulator n=1 Tax=Nonomuraea sp. NPDC049419 TaxID=3155772 RepID=UPI003415B873